MNMRNRPKPSKKRQEAERKAQKQQAAMEALASKPLKTQVFKLIQDLDSSQFQIQELEGELVLFHISGNVAFYEEHIALYSGDEVRATISMKNKSGTYTEWYTDVYEEAKKKYVEHILQEVIMYIAPEFAQQFHSVDTTPTVPAKVQKSVESVVTTPPAKKAEPKKEEDDDDEDEEEVDATAQAILRARRMQASLGEATEESDLQDGESEDSEEEDDPHYEVGGFMWAPTDEDGDDQSSDDDDDSSEDDDEDDVSMNVDGEEDWDTDEDDKEA